MKITLLITCFLALTVTSYSQQNHQSQPPDYEYYLQKSKNQKVLGYTVLGLGAAAFTIPVIIYASDPYFDASELNSGVGPFSILVGAGMVVGSIPIFIASGINKRKAMSLSLKNETAPYIQSSSLLYKGVPSLSLKIGL